MSLLKKLFGSKPGPAPVSLAPGELSSTMVAGEPADVPTAAPLDTARQMQLDEVFSRALNTFADCNAVACVDIEGHQLLALHSNIDLPPPVSSLIASAATDLFTAPNLLKIAAAFRQQHAHLPPEDAAHFQEMIVNGAGTLYFLLRVHPQTPYVCVFSCVDGHNSMGMMLHEARQIREQAALILMPVSEA